MPNVLVTVNSGVISCSPDPVLITGSNVTITFDLQSMSGHRFATSGAVVVSSPGSQFPSAAVTVSTNQVTLVDVNSDTNTYKYSVNLIRTSDNAPVTVDPSIKNGH